MFAMLGALPLAFAATAFSLLVICIEIGVFLTAVILQFFIVRYKSKRAGLVLPLLALCVCTLSVLADMLIAIQAEDFQPMLLLSQLPLLLVRNLPAGLLLLERRIILKRFCKSEPQTAEAAR